MPTSPVIQKFDEYRELLEQHDLHEDARTTLLGSIDQAKFTGYNFVDVTHVLSTALCKAEFASKESEDLVEFAALLVSSGSLMEHMVDAPKRSGYSKIGIAMMFERAAWLAEQRNATELTLKDIVLGALGSRVITIESALEKQGTSTVEILRYLDAPEPYFRLCTAF